MAMQLNPDYLHCDKDGSDKWYVAVLVDSKKNQALIGYGPCKPNARGTWKQVTWDEMQKRVSEKLSHKKGYNGGALHKIPKPALQEMDEQLCRLIGIPQVTREASGKISFDLPGMTATKFAAGKPKLRRRPPALTDWI
ncbi:hypothetical protein CKO28_00825 [Rhodovibrio sodomensis]|uniref:Uncharacterized protein n=1 Tax=Rhodovibrio sodomensis TaxID=1088 RepID=A0ABS1D8A6_9PROT|nr:hypothetical protein [Rhodovibrio sodomensis]MBK1666585.1 hypothetical protein [Rhodovibrio sodomensis]